MKLSIIVAVYNHEKYIEQTIKSIIEQDINCDYEVLVGEDCSTDNTRTVLKKIEKMCPQNFHFYYRDSNLGCEKNFTDLYSRMKGEYFVIIEGDDYWIENSKIQKQIDFLDENREYIACAHQVIVVDENSKKLDISYPACTKPEYSLFDYMKGILPGQTATIVSRNYYLNPQIDKSILFAPYYAGDRRRAFFLACNGRIACFNNEWSAYRYITSGGSSFSANIKETQETRKQEIAFAEAEVEYSKKIKNIEAQKVSEALLLIAMYGGWRYGLDDLTLYSILRRFVKSKYKLFSVKALLNRLKKKKENTVR